MAFFLFAAVAEANVELHMSQDGRVLYRYRVRGDRVWVRSAVMNFDADRVACALPAFDVERRIRGLCTTLSRWPKPKRRGPHAIVRIHCDGKTYEQDARSRAVTQVGDLFTDLLLLKTRGRELCAR